MNDINKAHLGIKNNLYYFYSICGLVGLNILSNIINYQYTDATKELTRQLTDKYKDSPQTLESISGLLKESAELSLPLIEKFNAQLQVTSFFSVLSTILFITAIVFLAKTVLNYYGVYSKSKEGKTLVTPAGAAWGWFIPILNLFRPFNTTNEVLNGETVPEMDSQISLAKFSFYAAVILPFVNLFFATFTPTAINIAVSSVAALLFLYSSYLMYQVHVRIFEKQNQ